MAIKNINMAKVFSSANTKQSLRLVCDYIDADELEVNPENEIIYGKLNIDDLKAEIIRSGGVKNPIEVIKKDEKLIIISGHRRQLATLQAFNEGKLSSKKVPYFINDTIKSLDDEKMAIIGRNTQREKDFKTRFNEITILTEILSKEVQNEKGRFRKNIADRIGISEAELQRYWDYNKFCPEIREAVEDLNEDYSPKQEDGKKDTPKPKNDKLSKSTNQDNIPNTVTNPKIKTIENSIENDNEDIELSAIETCLSVLNTKKNELDTLLNTIKDDDKGLKMLATIDYLDKLIAKCEKDLDIKLERGNINENNREGDI